MAAVAGARISVPSRTHNADKRVRQPKLPSTHLRSSASRPAPPPTNLTPTAAPCNLPLLHALDAVVAGAALVHLDGQVAAVVHAAEVGGCWRGAGVGAGRARLGCAGAAAGGRARLGRRLQSAGAALALVQVLLGVGPFGAAGFRPGLGHVGTRGCLQRGGVRAGARSRQQQAAGGSGQNGALAAGGRRRGAKVRGL